MRRLRSCLASTGSGGRRRPSAPTTRGCASARDGAGERRRKPSGSAPSLRRTKRRTRRCQPEAALRSKIAAMARRKATRTTRGWQAAGGPRPATSSRRSARHSPRLSRGTPDGPVCAAARCRRRVGARTIHPRRAHEIPNAASSSRTRGPITSDDVWLNGVDLTPNICTAYGSLRSQGRRGV